MPFRAITLAMAGTLALSLSLAGLGTASAQTPQGECRVPGIQNSVQCGVVHRLLDPARPAGPTIDIHYVVVPAMARRKIADPVFLLAGGPGQSAIDVAPALLGLFSRLNNRRDIVFVDQRGTGRSAPLVCDDPQRESLADQADPERQLQHLMDCKAAFLKLPYIRSESDLGFFTTTLAMQDLDAVRRQVGAERIDLIGVSYGTRAGLEYMRQFPQAVRRSVLDAVAPADMALPESFSTDGQAALDALFAACSPGDGPPGECARRYPALRSDWSTLLASLPKPVSAAHPLTGEVQQFTLTRQMLISAVRDPLYVPSMASALPEAITAAAHGRFEPLLGVGAMLAARRGMQLAMGMHFSVVCAEDMPLIEREAGNRSRKDWRPKNPPGADFGDADARFYGRVCARWPRGAVPQAFYSVPPSRTPTLLLSGGLDPATPPRHAAEVARALGPAAQHVVVPNAGHGVMSIGCMRDVIYRFIDTESDADATAIDASCVKSIPRPPAFVPVGAPAAVTEAR